MTEVLESSHSRVVEVEGCLAVGSHRSPVEDIADAADLHSLAVVGHRNSEEALHNFVVVRSLVEVVGRCSWAVEEGNHCAADRRDNRLPDRRTFQKVLQALKGPCRLLTLELESVEGFEMLLLSNATRRIRHVKRLGGVLG